MVPDMWSCLTLEHGVDVSQGSHVTCVYVRFIAAEVHQEEGTFR